MSLRSLVYSLYERRLAGKLAGRPVPQHVGVMCDGNRRWAREMGYVDPNDGHRVGAVRIKELLGWCDQAGIGHVTLYLLATDNLQRPAAELDPLVKIIEDLATELAEDGNPWRLRLVGALDVLPTSTATALKAAQEKTRHRTEGVEVNLAVGYGGRREITDAVRSLLYEHSAAGRTLEEYLELRDLSKLGPRFERDPIGVKGELIVRALSPTPPGAALVTRIMKFLEVSPDDRIRVAKAARALLPGPARPDAD